MTWESCDENVSRFYFNEMKAADIPMFKNQTWKEYRVLEDSPAGNLNVVVEKNDGHVKAVLTINKVCLVPFHWFNES